MDFSDRLDDFDLAPMSFRDRTRDVLVAKASGRPVILMHEIFGLRPPVVALARLLVAAGFKVYLPVLFGGSEPRSQLRGALAFACVAHQFRLLTNNDPGPWADWILRSGFFRLQGRRAGQGRRRDRNVPDRKPGAVGGSQPACDRAGDEPTVAAVVPRRWPACVTARTVSRENARDRREPRDPAAIDSNATRSASRRASTSSNARSAPDSRGPSFRRITRSCTASSPSTSATRAAASGTANCKL